MSDLARSFAARSCALLPTCVAALLCAPGGRANEILPNACFIEAVIFVERYLDAHPGERADAFNFPLCELGLPPASGAHTIAIFTHGGELWGWDYTLGAFPIGAASLLGKERRLAHAVVAAFRDFAPEARAAQIGRRDDVLDGVEAERQAALLALRRLGPVARHVGRAQLLRLTLDAREVDAVIFGFKGHLCVYRPRSGTTCVKLCAGETTRAALQRMPALATLRAVRVVPVVDGSLFAAP